MSNTPETTDLRKHVADVLTPFFLNFSDLEAAKGNAEEAAEFVLAVLPAPVDRTALAAQFGEVLQRWGLLDEVNDPEAAKEFAVTDLLAVLPAPGDRAAVPREAADHHRGDSMAITVTYRVRCSGPCRCWLSLPDDYQGGEDFPLAALVPRPSAARAGMWPDETAARRAAFAAGWSGGTCPECRMADEASR